MKFNRRDLGWHLKTLQGGSEHAKYKEETEEYSTKYLDD